MTKVFKIIMNIVMVLFIAVLLALFIPPVLGVTTVVGGSRTKTNMSMGTVAYGTRVGVANLKEGDTIISNTSDETYLYKIVKKVDEEGTFTVSTGSKEEEITVTRTASRLLLTVPVIGFVALALQSVEGLIIFALCITIIVILFIISEILYRRSMADEEDEEDDYEKDREYFRDLADSTGKPSSLDSLTAIPDPPVADIMESVVREEELQTEALDNEGETFDFESMDNTMILTDEADSSEDITGEKMAVVSEEIQEKNEISTQSEQVFDFSDEAEDIKADNAFEVSQKEAEEEKIIPEDTELTKNLEDKILEFDTDQKEEDKDEKEEIELAMPIYTVDELVGEAHKNKEEPKVYKDDVTGTTFVDFSDCI